MSQRCNYDARTQATAALDFLERVVRNQLPDARRRTADSDYPFMADCVTNISAHNACLAKGIQTHSWSQAFVRVIQKAHSLRVVRIDRDTKDGRRQRHRRCDACANEEHCCAYAVDLLGNFDPGDAKDVFHSHTSYKSRWLAVSTGGDAPRLADSVARNWREVVDPDGRGSHDWGRFFLGKSCLFYAQLYMATSNIIPNLLAAAHEATRTMTADEKMYSAHVYAVDDNIDALVEYQEQLDYCVRKPGGGDAIPPTPFERPNVWAAIDRERLNHAARETTSYDDVARHHAASLLIAAEQEPTMQSEEEGHSDEDDEDDRRPSPIRKRNRARVVDDTDSDESDDEVLNNLPKRKRGPDPNVTPRVTRLQASRKAAARVTIDVDEDVESEMSGSPASSPSSSVTPGSDERSETGDADEADEASSPPPLHGPDQSRAIAMRIPRNGARGELPSRNDVLVGLLAVSTELTRRNEHDLARHVDMAVITMRELVEIVQRKQGRRN